MDKPTISERPSSSHTIAAHRRSAVIEVFVESIRVNMTNYRRVVMLKEKTSPATCPSGSATSRRTPSPSRCRTCPSSAR